MNHNKIQIGEDVTIYQGDCLEVMKTLDDNSVDAVITDPPYGTGGRDGAVHLNNRSISGNRQSRDSYIWFTRTMAGLLYEKTKANSHCSSKNSIYVSRGKARENLRKQVERFDRAPASKRR